MSLTGTSTIAHNALPPPRLRIYHLLACAAVTALQLTLWRNALTPELLQAIPVWARVMNAIALGMGGIGLTFALFSIYWQLKGYAALVQPGQWLLAVYLISTAQLFVGLVVRYLHVTSPWGKSLSLWSQQDKLFAILSVLQVVVIYINRLLPVALYIWCAWRVADSRPWRIVFWFRTAISLLGIVGLYGVLVRIFHWSLPRVLSVQSLFVSSALASIMAYIIATERRGEPKRYWTHWLGVAVCVATELIYLAGGLIGAFG